MSFDWFPFNTKDFLANTRRLNTEAKGAYLLLMLDYYEQGEGPPDDDDVLATICELPLETWQRHRRVISPMFEIRDGRWRHDRIKSEMEKAERKHAEAVAKAKNASSVRWKKADSDASSIHDASSKPVPLPLQKKDSLSVDSVTVEKSENRDNQVPEPNLSLSLIHI